MSIYLGLDIGAVSLKLAATGVPEDNPWFETLIQQKPAFFSASFPVPSSCAARPLALSHYRRIQGSPVQATLDLLQEFFAVVPREQVQGMRVIGSGSRLIAGILEVEAENELRALAKAMGIFHPEVRTLFEMGGEASKYLRLQSSGDAHFLGIVDYQLSGECAAGTGSFLDQQASRLRYSVEEAGPAACGASCAARVAGRCSVFAKTDMIHAQQKGYTTDQILRGLCEAVARNFKSSIVKSRPVLPPVAFVGAVARNEAVRRALRAAFRLKEEEFFVPQLHCWLGAIGAALFAVEQPEARNSSFVARLQEHAAAAPAFDYSEPLSMAGVVLLRNRVAPPPISSPPGRTEAYLGIDIGSVSTNLVVLDGFGKLLKEIYLPTAGRPIEVVNSGLQEIQRELGDRLDIRGVGATGSGRELIGELTGADTVNDEITAHKTGALHVCHQLRMPAVDTIFEIGGQDSKFIRLDRGVVVDFAMNEACAAGTGSFLEEQAEKLGISIKDEFARLALASRSPARLGERCTVFMERDVTRLLLKGASVGDLCAGLAYSVAINYLNRVVRGRRIGDVIYFQGGTAYNDAVAAAFFHILGKTIIVPPHNGVIGAIGMALIARERMQGSGRASRFRGYDLSRVRFTSRDFVCRACSNYCDMKEIIIDGKKTYWGDKCSDKFRKPCRSERQPVIRDLMEYRDQLLSFEEPIKDGRPTVGIPRAMFFYDRFPFWRAYLQELGFGVQVSPVTDGRIVADGDELAIAQPCFPIQLAHGHVRALLNLKVDYILIPNQVDAETPEMSVPSHLCPWNQTLPFVVRAAPQLEEELRGRLLCPTVHFRLGREHVYRELRPLARALRRNGRDHQRALAAAFSAQDAFKRELLRAGEEALAKIQSCQAPAIVLIGRPYNLYDRNANCDMPRKLRTLYGVNVVPLDFLPLDREDISSINDNMYWNSGRLILAAARITQRNPNLHLIYLSNFKCGPDSYIKSFLADAAGKPALVLQFDAHSNDAGYLTRCEAYLDSKGFLRCTSSAIAA